MKFTENNFPSFRSALRLLIVMSYQLLSVINTSMSSCMRITTLKVPSDMNFEQCWDNNLINFEIWQFYEILQVTSTFDNNELPLTLSRAVCTAWTPTKPTLNTQSVYFACLQFACIQLWLLKTFSSVI